jgi:predicted nuclease of predicted toxin-antitoxin system
MKLILNENMPSTVTRLLRERGHDVLAVKESLRGADDPDILARAQAEFRIVVTQDKDFGELAFRFGLPAQCGIILFRLRGSDPDADNRRMVEVVESRADWAGQFAVATDDRVRMRPLRSIAGPARPNGK